MHPIIEDLNWRYATKKFDSSKKISDSDLGIIEDSLRLAASSYGLQPIKYILVESSSIREELKQASYGQAQVAEASHLIVFCVYRTINEEYVDNHIALTVKSRKLETDSLTGYGNHIKKTVTGLSEGEIISWNSKQAYLSLGQLLHTCASLRIDSTPMEGFDKEKFDYILDLKEQNLTAILACPIGYRHAEDKSQFQAKVRKSKNDLFLKS